MDNKELSIDDINLDEVDTPELSELLGILEGMNDELDNIEGDLNEED